MPDPIELIQRGIHLQSQINRLVRNLGPDDPWLAVELTMPQLKVLFRLNAQGPARVGALARALRVTLPTMTGILDRLVEQGLIRRDEDPTDRRLVISRLTPEGQELVDQLQAAGRTRLARVYEALSPDDLARHVAALECVLHAAETIAASEQSEPAPSGATAQ
ncbi:MAG: MarR family winged helix-turn-helix transcriptional regulator [Chloroflexota bacterium]